MVEANSMASTIDCGTCPPTTMKRITRRAFLQQTSLAAGAIAALAPHARVLGANDDLRVAVVGFNSQGRTHLREHLAVNGVDWTKTEAVLGPWLELDAEKEQFVGGGDLAAKANRLMTRPYRSPFVVPEKV